MQSTAENVEEWLALHSSGQFERLFNGKAVRGELRRSALRAVLWKARLIPVRCRGCENARLFHFALMSPHAQQTKTKLQLNGSLVDWIAQLRERRAAYDKLKQRYLVDPHAHPTFDPLSQAEEVCSLNAAVSECVLCVLCVFVSAFCVRVCVCVCVFACLLACNLRCLA